jgi:hypothetical protein
VSIQFATGVVEARHAGSDEFVCWLTLRHASGMKITRIFDYRRISSRLITGHSYELLLALSYPDCADDHTETWQGTIISLRYPKPNGNVLVREIPLEVKRRNGILWLPKKRKNKPTGPLCALVQTPIGFVVATMSVLQQYYACQLHVGSTFSVPRWQRLDLLAVL